MNKKSKSNKDSKKNQVGEQITSENSKINTSKEQFLFLGFIIVVLAIFIPFTIETIKYYNYFQENAPEGYQWPTFSEFNLTIFTVIFFYGLEKIVTKLCYNPFLSICKEQTDLLVREKRTKKAVNNIYKFFVYCFTTFFGVYAMKDSFILPPSLGGKGQIIDIFTDFPYFKREPLYVYYFTGCLGFHIVQTVQHLFEKEKMKDYIEMVLHHLVTIYLIVFSHMTNTIVGGIVLILHDSGDIIICFTRALSETAYKKSTGVCFVFVMLSFLYTRLIMFPYVIYVSTIKIPVFSVSPYLQPIFCFLMSCLTLLHVYWFYLMLKIFANIFIKNQYEDIVNKIEDPNKKKRQIKEKSK